MVTCPEIRSMEVSHLGRAWSGTLQRSAPGRAERDETCVEQRRTAADVQALAPGDNDHRAPHRGWRNPVPPPVTNAASIFGQSMLRGLALQRATMASSQAAPNAPKNGT